LRFIFFLSEFRFENRFGDFFGKVTVIPSGYVDFVNDSVLFEALADGEDFVLVGGGFPEAFEHALEPIYFAGLDFGDVVGEASHSEFHLHFGPILFGFFEPDLDAGVGVFDFKVQAADGFVERVLNGFFLEAGLDVFEVAELERSCPYNREW
jgi:hypothetical protein